MIMNYEQSSQVILDAARIYDFDEPNKEKDVTLSVVAGPFYMPKKATASFTESGSLKIHFFYSQATKSEKTGIKNAQIDGVEAHYEEKTGRVLYFIIPKVKVPKQDSVHLKLEIEGVFNDAMNSCEYLSEKKNQDKLNFGSLNAAVRSLKAYAGEYSKVASEYAAT